MATKVICDRCGKDVEHSDTQLVVRIGKIVGKDLLLYAEKDYCKSCFDTVLLTIKLAVNQTIDMEDE